MTIRRIPALPLLLILAALLIAAPASAAVDKTFKLPSGQRLDWSGESVTGMTNYYYWDPVGAGNLCQQGTCVAEHTKCTKDRTSYCEQILVELSNPPTAAEIAAGKTEKLHPATVWLDEFGAPGGPVNDFDLLVYESDASGRRGTLIQSDGNMQNTTKELVTFDVLTTVEAPSQFILIDVVYYQVVNGRYVGHVTF